MRALTKAGVIANLPLVDLLPNATDVEQAAARASRGFKHGGTVVPFHRNQTALAYNSALVTKPPQTFEELLVFARERSRKVTVTDPTHGGSGSGFLESALLKFSPECKDDYYNFDLTKEQATAAAQKCMAPVLAYWRSLKPYVKFSNGNENSIKALANNVALVATVWEDDLYTLATKGLVPQSARPVLLQTGQVGDGDGLFIVASTQKLEAALLYANFLMSDKVQIDKLEQTGSRTARVNLQTKGKIPEKLAKFLILLGPSGCGKTTTLRIIAGLVDPDEGEVLLDGKHVQHLPAHRRQTAMVFQSYALFPHMTVSENIGFGLRMRAMPTDLIQQRVGEALALVELEGLSDRYPRHLSGGQQQRVAVARAIVTRPKVLLFDEPLSNLDAKLRERLRLELRALQQRLGVTTVYVTHDQAEALALSDRVAVMFGGKVVEIGTPRQVYRTPRARVTAEFLGVTNFLDGQVAAVADGHCIVQTPLGMVEADAGLGVRMGEVVTLSFRPEDVRVGRYEGTAVTGRVLHASYLGSVTDYVVESGGVTLRVHA